MVVFSLGIMWKSIMYLFLLFCGCYLEDLLLDIGVSFVSVMNCVVYT